MRITATVKNTFDKVNLYTILHRGNLAGLRLSEAFPELMPTLDAKYHNFRIDGPDNWPLGEWTGDHKNVIRWFTTYGWVDVVAKSWYYQGPNDRLIKKAVGIHVYGGKAQLVLGTSPSTRKNRDHQRQRVYDAERLLKTAHGRINGKFNSPTEVKLFIEMVQASDWFKANCPRSSSGTIRLVFPNRKHQSATGGIAGLTFPRWAWNEMVVLHELAHYVNQNEGRSDSHGPAFVKIFLELVSQYMGPIAASLLLDGIINKKVKVAATWAK